MKLVVQREFTPYASLFNSSFPSSVANLMYFGECAIILKSFWSGFSMLYTMLLVVLFVL